MKRSERQGFMAGILIVEDDREISQLLAEFLDDNGYDTFCINQGLSIASILKDQKIDLILLDLMLPYKSGEQLLAEIRALSSVPVIIISAKGATQTKVELLRLGADDYITKPFELEETLARIESNLRRAGFREAAEHILQYHNLILDRDKHTVSVLDKELGLTAKEYSILELLLQHPEKVFSKANLFQSIWDEEYLCEDNTLNVHISNLRTKLKAADPQGEYIDTVWGIGYRLHKD